MPHVSQNKLDQKIKQKIDRFLMTILAIPDSRHDATKIIGSLLTPTEKTMLAKRIFILFLLLNKESYYSISQELKVSSSTVARFDEKLERGDFKHLLPYIPVRKSNVCVNDRHADLFFATLYAFLGSNRSIRRLKELQKEFKK